jgi:transcription initiation factor IIE alpha subunit
MNDTEEIKRLEEMLLDATDDHFRCADCKRVFHEYDKYSGLNEIGDCLDYFCQKCGEMNERARADDEETYAMLRNIR